MSFLVCGTILETIAAGLLSTLGLRTRIGEWIGYQILAGVGSGIALPIPFIAIQASLKPDDIPLGSKTANFLKIPLLSYCSSLLTSR